jgi:serine/threonine protein kinase
VRSIQTTLSVGSVIQGRYKVERLLGKGGFGAVYLVSDRRVRGNLFALKELCGAGSSERQQFTFEGRVLSRLDHLSLPRVYRTFEDAKRERAYILMDYIKGQNLEVQRKRQSDERYSTAHVLHLLKPIFEAVGYLHQQDPPIVHRDIKPSNIIVPVTADELVLVDFGIAKEYVQDSTTAAVRLCSPGYGAPEQYAGGTDTRTDIYGLAATMYVLLTGQLPADALHRMTSIGSKRGDVLIPPVELVSTIPQHVSDAIMRALSIASDERFATTQEFWEALHAQPIEENSHEIGKESNNAVEVTLPALAPPLGAIQDGSVSGKRGREVAAKTEEIFRSVDAAHRTSMQKRWGVLAVPIVLALVALGSGLLYGSNWFSLVGREPTTATPIPTVVRSMSQPTAPPHSASPYPSLADSYSGSIADQQTSPPTITTMTLSDIRQKKGTIHGTLSLGPGLQGDGSFSGSVSSDGTIRFTVPGLYGHLPLLFQGTIQPDGTISGTYGAMSGTYCSYHEGDDHCDHDAGGYGNWQVTAAVS